jgi:glycerophosphoryl diester phosphodiesterase
MTKTNKIPTLIAHRGYSGRYPENTLIAYQAAFDCGARFVELDLQFTSDIIPVLHHDVSLNRMAGIDVNIFDISYEQFAKYPASYMQRFGNKFLDNKFSSFKIFCEWLKQNSEVTAFVEIKQESIDYYDLNTIMESTYQQIKNYNLQSQCIIISFNHKVVEYTHANTTMKTGWVLPAWSHENHQQLKVLKPNFVFCDVDKLPKINEDIWQGSWMWATYNSDDIDSAIAIANRGINFIETNEIGTLIKDKRLAT